MTQGNLFDRTYSKRLAARFDGATIEPQDVSRLSTALGRVFNLMTDGKWRTLSQIASECETSEAGASARLRDLRKSRFGRHTVDRKRIVGGLFAYRLVVQ